MNFSSINTPSRTSGPQQPARLSNGSSLELYRAGVPFEFLCGHKLPSHGNWLSFLSRSEKMSGLCLDYKMAISFQMFLDSSSINDATIRLYIDQILRASLRILHKPPKLSHQRLPVGESSPIDVEWHRFLLSLLSVFLLFYCYI